MLRLKLYEMDPAKTPNGYWSDNERTILEAIVEDHTQGHVLLKLLAVHLGEEGRLV